MTTTPSKAAMRAAERLTDAMLGGMQDVGLLPPTLKPGSKPLRDALVVRSAVFIDAEFAGLVKQAGYAHGDAITIRSYLGEPWGSSFDGWTGPLKQALADTTPSPPAGGGE